MDKFIENLVNDLKKDGLNVTVIEGTGDPTPVLSKLLEAFSNEEYNPNNPNCVNRCPNRALCRMVSEYRKTMREMEAKKKASEQRAKKETFKDYREFEEASDWLGDILTTLVKKNADYGDAFKNITKDDKTYPCNQILTKAYRIKSLINSTGKPNYESVEDSLKDLVGYAILTHKALKDGTLKL